MELETTDAVEDDTAKSDVEVDEEIEVEVEDDELLLTLNEDEDLDEEKPLVLCELTPDPKD